MARRINNASTPKPTRSAKTGTRTSRYHAKQVEAGAFDDVQPGAPVAKRVPPLEYKTERQRELGSAMEAFDQIFVMGPAGTGKTFVPLAVAAKRFAAKQIERIVLARPNVDAGPTLGLKPGTEEEKIAPWAVPMIEALEMRLGKGRVEYEMKAGNIQIVAFETMRGRTFRNAFVLLDEGQNTTPKEMEMFLTRMGEGSSVVVNGDIGQKDIPSTSGLAHALTLIRRFRIPAAVVEFTLDDIVRGGICAMWARAYHIDKSPSEERAGLDRVLQRGAGRDEDLIERVHYVPET